MSCPKCNYELSPFDEECPRCKRLAEAAQAAPPPPPPAAWPSTWRTRPYIRAGLPHLDAGDTWRIALTDHFIAGTGEKRD